MKELIEVAGMFIVVAMIIIAPVVAFKYTQRYTQDSNTTATKGIFFERTIDLTKYKKLGNGNGLFGKYDRYSRSDRHDHVLTIYKD